MSLKFKEIFRFIQDNIGDEPQKGGCAIAELGSLLAEARAADIPLAGLMCVPPEGIEGLSRLTIVILNIPQLLTLPGDREGLLHFGTPYIISAVIMLAVLRIKDTTQQHIHRLETINRVSRQIMLSLETEHTLSLLNATIREALQTDTYFVGLLKENAIHLELFYDEGEYYTGVRLPLDTNRRSSASPKMCGCRRSIFSQIREMTSSRVNRPASSAMRA